MSALCCHIGKAVRESLSLSRVTLLLRDSEDAMSMRSLRRSRQFRLLTLFLSASVLVLALSAPVSAQTNSQDKISAPLLAQMASNPLQRLPIILEMNPPTSPFSSGVNSALAQQAVTILQANGQAVGGLPIIEAAAGYATA